MVETVVAMEAFVEAWISRAADVVAFAKASVDAKSVLLPERTVLKGVAAAVVAAADANNRTGPNAGAPFSEDRILSYLIAAVIPVLLN